MILLVHFNQLLPSLYYKTGKYFSLNKQPISHLINNLLLAKDANKLVKRLLQAIVINDDLK